jgi:hypothetical protein
MFAKFRTATSSFVMSVRLSVRHPSSVCRELIRFHWANFEEIWHLSLFRKYVEKIQVLLKSDKNHVYFTWRLFTFMSISRWILFRMRNTLDKLYRENQSARFIFNNFYRKSCRLWNNVKKCDGAREATNDNKIRRMCFACWISNATGDHAHAHDKNDFANAPQYYVIRTLSV